MIIIPPIASRTIASGQATAQLVLLASSFERPPSTELLMFTAKRLTKKLKSYLKMLRSLLNPKSPKPEEPFFALFCPTSVRCFAASLACLASAFSRAMRSCSLLALRGLFGNSWCSYKVYGF